MVLGMFDPISNLRSEEWSSRCSHAAWSAGTGMGRIGRKQPGEGEENIRCG